MRLHLPSIGMTDGSLMEGEMARFSATAASARRPRALRGGVEESLGRLVKPVSPAGPAKEAAASRLRSEGSPGAAGFSRVTAVLPSPLCPLEPSAMKSPGGGCAARGQGADVTPPARGDQSPRARPDPDRLPGRGDDQPAKTHRRAWARRWAAARRPPSAGSWCR